VPQVFAIQLAEIGGRGQISAPFEPGICRESRPKRKKLQDHAFFADFSAILVDFNALVRIVEVP